MSTTQFELIADGMTFTEAPRWRDGAVYFSDFYTNAVYRASTMDGFVSKVVEVRGRPSGLGWLPDGTLLVVSQHDRAVHKVVEGELVVHADLSGHAEGNPNDMLVLPDGTAYVGDIAMDPNDYENIGYGSLIRVTADGDVAIVSGGLRFPNGITTLSDGRLVMAESFGNRLSTFESVGDGDEFSRTDWATFGPCSESRSLGALVEAAVVSPDGICVDAEDGIWVADCFHHRVLRVLEGGLVTDEIDVGDSQAYAVALGGDDGCELFICTAPSPYEHERSETRDGKVISTRVAVPAPHVQATKR